MKKLSGSLFLKLLSFVLVCVFTPVLIGCAFFASESYDEGIYFGENKTFSKSKICENFVSNELANINNYVYWNDISGLEKAERIYEETNLGFVIYDLNGKIVFTNMKSSAGKQEFSDGGYILIKENYPLKEVDSEGKTVAEYTMNGYIRRNMQPDWEGYERYAVFEFISRFSVYFVYGIVFSFAICTLCCIYLISAAGYDKDGNLGLRGLNAIGYDIMLVLCVIGISALIEVFSNLRWSFYDVYKFIACGFVFAGMTAVTLIGIMSSAAHFKMKKWWHHTLIWQCFYTVIKFIRWFMRNIGITWKLAAIVFGYSLIIFILGVSSWEYNVGVFAVLLTFFVIAGGVCVAIWFGTQLKQLKRGGEAIANGDFDYRINSKELWPMLRSHAYNLNSAAVGMSKAVDDRLKSERFKTELITNVSHDLKTPLTSIVSYVDLLKKEDIQSENAKEYIDVIERQSAKLKKLTEDLVEASKASSGAVAVNREQLNIGELINQSVGEFSEKLEDAKIIPVINLPEEEVLVYTDGRLLWRVFDNLIQNIIKYAQPGTRAYFDLFEEEGSAVLTIKNISREPLNMSAEALMERFIRGDASRNSEGNGLGLSIAKSLTELCGGTFELSLDGDLYKVIITIPKSEKDG